MFLALIPLLLEHAVLKAKPLILARQISLRRWDQVRPPILCNPLAQRRLANPQIHRNPLTRQTAGQCNPRSVLGNAPHCRRCFTLLLELF